MTDRTQSAAAPDERDAMLRRGPFLAVLLQGLPLAIGLASHAVINLVDLALVGRLGDDAVQSAHVASTWNFLPMIVGQCVSTALIARLSRRLGDDDAAGARTLNVRAQWFMVWLGAVVSVLSAFPAMAQVEATGVAGNVADDACHYLVVSNLGCLSMFVLMQTTAAMRAAGEALAPLALLLFANVLNLLLDFVLLFGWEAMGIPAIGVAGAAYASVASRTIAALLAWWWLRRRRHVLSLRGERREDHTKVAAPLLNDAWPQMLQIGLRAAIVLALTVIVQRRFGDVATVSLGLTTRLDTLVLFSALGFANAATAYSGRAVASGRAAEARRAGCWAMLQSMAFGALFVCIYQQSTDTIVGWFLVDPSDEVVQLTALYFATAAWSQLFGAGAFGAIGAVHGTSRMVAPLVVDLCGFAIAASLLWSATDAGASLRDVYVALFWGMVAVAGCHLVFVLRGAWTKPV